MRTTILLSCSLLLIAFPPPRAAAVTPIYVSFHSHNEEAAYWTRLITNRRGYQVYRDDLIERVELLTSRGATLNWQSDHGVLRAMAAHESGRLLRATGGKNVLRWMVEDKGVEVDPHGHLTTYNYADLAHLIAALGVTPSGTIGGVTIYECGTLPGTMEWIDWTSVVELQSDGTIRGLVYPDAVWTPDLLHGAAMAGHGYDDSTSGAWNCGAGSDYHTHQPAGSVTVIGAGYTGDQLLVGSGARYSGGAYLYELADKIASGELAPDGLYTASVMVRDLPGTTEVPDTNAALESFLDAVQPLVDSGQVVYATLGEVRDLWQTTYASSPTQVGPEQLSAYDEVVLEVCRRGDFACGTDTCTSGEVCDPAAAVCLADCRLSYVGCPSSSLVCNAMSGLCE